MNQADSNISQAAVPTQAATDLINADGKRIMNIDGEGIAGGRWVAGLSGYDLAGSQAAGVSKCAAFPLFCMQSLPYTATSIGWQCSTNAVNLNNERHKW